MKLIESYPRAQAIEDGVLIDVTDRARAAGIKPKTAVSRTALSRYVEATATTLFPRYDKNDCLSDILQALRGQLQGMRLCDATLVCGFFFTINVGQSQDGPNTTVEFEGSMFIYSERDIEITVTLPGECFY